MDSQEPNRVSRQLMFMEMAEVVAKRSTCFRGNVGSIVVKDNQVLSIGYNGPPSGEPHCQGGNCELTGSGGCKRSIHAEINALKFAALNGRSTHSADLYSTAAPCINCAQAIFNSYVSRVFYRYPYKTEDGLNFLTKSSRSLQVFRVTPSGYLISHRSGNIVSPADLR